jgi:Flp pilus assembly protein TadD
VLLHIFNNLALIAAKTGEPRAADRWLDKAQSCLARVPGERPRFFVNQAEAIVNLSLGNLEKAEESARAAIRRGKKTGDMPHVRFLELYLGEALLERAHYGTAEKVLRRLGRSRPPPHRSRRRRSASSPRRRPCGKSSSVSGGSARRISPS